MIQRLQSLYLFLSAALLAVFLFLPIARFEAADSIYRFTSQSIATVADSMPRETDSTVTVSVATWGISILGTLISVLMLITIFLYKNRPWQARLCMINAFFLVTLYIVVFLSGYTFMEDLQSVKVSWSASMLLPFVSLVLDVMAYKAIERDEHLVRSLDRIR